jgi:tetratricopeptide (TPR) repeat protein
MEDIEEDLELRLENAETHATHGDVLREMGQQSDALRAYTQALELDPNSAPGLVGRGYCDYDKGDWENAIADFPTDPSTRMRRCISRKPRSTCGTRNAMTCERPT